MQSIHFLTHYRLRLMEFSTIRKELILKKSTFLPFSRILRSPHTVFHSARLPKQQKNVGFVITCLECQKPRLLHSKNKMKKDDLPSAKRMMQKVSYMCGAALTEYVGSGNDRDERYLKSIYVRENISCTSKIELPYFSVDNYPIVCIYCGIGGTHRTLNSSVELYPKCNGCTEQPDVLRRKRKAQGDFCSKKKK